MEVNTFKKELLKIYTDYIGKINQEKQIERIETVNALNELHPDYLKMSDSLKYLLIDEYMYLLSFYKDNEVLEILNRFHLTFFTPKVFIDYKSVLKSIQKHNADSSLLFPVETIFLAYNAYSRFIVKEAICNDLDIDYTKIAEKMNRQYKAGNSPKPLVDQIDFLKQVKKLLKLGFWLYKKPERFVSKSLISAYVASPMPLTFLISLVCLKAPFSFL
mgnify:CR=1 FL=1